MDENNPDLPGGIDRLLERKAFGELSDSERTRVLSHLREEQYTRLRRTVLLARDTAEQRIQPDPWVKERLMATFDKELPAEKRDSRRTVSRLLIRPVPLYQAGVAASLLLAVLFYFLLKQDDPGSRVAVADTVYIEKILPGSDTVRQGDALLPAEKGSMPHRAVRSGPSAPPEPTRYAVAGNTGGNSYPQQQMEEALERVVRVSDLERGRSRMQDTSLLHLLVAVY